jgi:hypothetical protein
MYLNDVDPRNEQFEEERSRAGFDNTTGTFTVKNIQTGNLFNKRDRSSINFLEGRESNTNVQTFIKEKNKLAPLLPDYKEQPIITDWKDSQEEKNNNNETIYGLPKMVVYGGGAVITLAILYFILKD